MHAGDQEPPGAIYCVGDALAPSGSQSDHSSSDTGCDPCLFVREASKAVHPYRQKLVNITTRTSQRKPKGDEIGAADWLKVAYAMSDAVHAA